MTKPRIDLGRPGYGVTWNEWMGRTGEAAMRALEKSDCEGLNLVVTLTDGRRINVRNTDVHTHDSGDESEVALITGYVFIGHYAAVEDDDRIVSLAVTPDMIASVEWMRVPDSQRFGFRGPHEFASNTREVNDHLPSGTVSLVQTTELAEEAN